MIQRSRSVASCGFLLAMLCMSGCFLDFESLPTRPDNDAQPLPDMSEDMADLPDTGEDVGEDADMTPDMVVEPVIPIGAACEEDSDCGDGKTCLDGFCTQSCTESSCPDGSLCSGASGTLQCVASCALEECLNPGLSCVTGFAGGEPQRLCLPDSDDDGASDYQDNCPETANPFQHDSDGDQIGDACDPEPGCFAGTADGRSSIAAGTLGRTGFSVPDFLRGPSLPLVSGLANGAPVDTITYLNLVDGSFEDGEKLPEPLIGMSLVPFGSGFLATPGAQAPGGVQTGHFLTLRDDEVAQGSVFGRALYEPTILPFENGEFWVTGWFQADPGTEWRTYRFNPATQTLDLRNSGGYTRSKWRAVKDRYQRGYFYTESEGGFLLMRITPRSGAIATTGVNFPGGAPFIVMGENERMWAFDRTTGEAYWFVFGGVVNRAPEYDQVWPFASKHLVAFESGQSFAIVEDAENPAAEVVSLGCIPALRALDADLDGVADILDNCAEVENANQSDIDFNGIGDACDADRDGDGIPNESDQVPDPNDGSLFISYADDTDNDGISNDADEDDDGDQIPDLLDRYPADSNNDGIPNWIDFDDDGDGYQDVTEDRLAGLHTNPLAFPNSGRLVWIETSNNAPQVHWADLARVTTAPNTVNVQGTPSLPRWHRNTELIVLDGPSGQATSWTRVDLESGLSSSTNLGGVLYGVDSATTSVGLNTIVASMEYNGAPALVRVTLQPSVLLEPLVTGLEVIGPPDFYQNQVGFATAYPGMVSMCSTCGLPYQLLFGTNDLFVSTGHLENVEMVRYSGISVMIARGTHGGRSAWTLIGATVTEFVPPGIVDVVSAVGFESERHLAVIGKTIDDVYELWFYNNRSGEWLRLTQSSNPLSDVDWIR